MSTYIEIWSINCQPKSVHIIYKHSTPLPVRSILPCGQAHVLLLGIGTFHNQFCRSHIHRRSNYYSNILCNFLDLPIRLWWQVVHQHIFLKRNGSTTTKQITNISNKIEKIVPSYVEIGVLLVHVESLTIAVLCLEINRLRKIRVQILLKILCDSLNERLTILSHFLTPTLMWQTSIELFSAEVWLMFLQAIEQEQHGLEYNGRISRKKSLEVELTGSFWA